jgi:hypothetical protein
LSPLVKLVRLYLDHTNVNGDVYGMSPLVELGNMRLEDTKVVGLAGALAPLVELALLNLTDTAVGCYRAFCTGRPFRANCVHGLQAPGRVFLHRSLLLTAARAPRTTAVRTQDDPDCTCGCQPPVAAVGQLHGRLFGRARPERRDDAAAFFV